MLYMICLISKEFARCNLLAAEQKRDRQVRAVCPVSPSNEGVRAMKAIRGLP
jgi:hypothetical protein